MPMTATIIYRIADEKRYCGLLLDGKLWQLTAEPVVGETFGYAALCRAKVIQELSPKNFLVDIGDTQPALWTLGTTDVLPSIGSLHTVQIKRPRQADKGAAVTSDLRWPTRGGAYHFSTPATDATATIAARAASIMATATQQNHAGPVAIILSAAQQVLGASPLPQRVYCADLAARQDWVAQTQHDPELAAMTTEIVSPAEFTRIDDWVEQWHAATRSEFIHPQGCRLVFETGQTLTAVDVDTRGMHSPPVTVNQSLVSEIARLLSLKNIGGIIVVDFLKMNRRDDRDAITTQMQDWLYHSPLGGQVFGFTATGLLEITRPKRLPPLPFPSES